MNLDLRITPGRDGFASRTLEGVVRAAAYVEPRRMIARAASAAIRRTPEAHSEQMDQLVFGEGFEVLDATGDVVWGQARRDGYVGFVLADALTPEGDPPSHRVCAIRTYAFAEPSIKSLALGPYSINSLLNVEARDGRFAKVAGAGWFVETHIAPIGRFDTEPAAVAERFLGAPYLWGGRESLGLDCSGLVQQALYACGKACPRDTDQQASLGTPIEPFDLQRGDLVFWRGHVAMMLDAQRILHANAHHMAVAIEPLAEALARIADAGSGEPVAYRRP